MNSREITTLKAIQYGTLALFSYSAINATLNSIEYVKKQEETPKEEIRYQEPTEEKRKKSPIIKKITIPKEMFAYSTLDENTFDSNNLEGIISRS